MDISLKNKIVEKIIKSEDEELLHEVSLLLGVSDNDFWDELPDEVKQDINIAKNELDSGEGISHKDIMNEVRQKYLS